MVMKWTKRVRLCSALVCAHFRLYFVGKMREFFWINSLLTLFVNKLFIQKNSLILPTMENPGCQIFSTIRLYFSFPL